MEFQSCFPIWDKLNTGQQTRILASLVEDEEAKAI